MKTLLISILFTLLFVSNSSKSDTLSGTLSGTLNFKFTRAPASNSKNCHDLIKSFNESSAQPPNSSSLEHHQLLGSGAGGSVYLITLPDLTSFVRKIYKSEKEFLNDNKALKFLSQIENSGQLSGVIKIIEPYLDKNKNLNKKDPLTALFKYHKGETLFDSIQSSKENAASLNLQYNTALRRLDVLINESGKLIGRSEFPLYNAKAIHYQFDGFNIVIHVKNILVTEEGLVLIDPH